MQQKYNTTKEINLILAYGVKDFIKCQGITQKKRFKTKDEFLKYIYKYDLKKFLGVGRRFNCIFHDDEKPSACIRLYDNSVYIYKCFGHCDEEKSYNK